MAEKDPAQAAYEIQERIKQLADLADEDLSGAMKDLKTALLENPNAVELMLPQDIGEMVKALRRITGEAALSATKKSSGGKKGSRKLTAEELAEALDDL